MDNKSDIEAVRARLKNMKRRDVVELAEKLGLSASTVQKFRNGHTTFPRASLFMAVRGALPRIRAEAPSGTPSPNAPSASASRTATA